MKLPILAPLTAALIALLSSVVAEAAPTYSVTDLGTLGGDYAYAFGISPRGFVTGYSYPAGNSVFHAFISGPKGPMFDLGSLGGTLTNIGTAINASNQVVGYSYLAGNAAYHAFISGTNGGTLIDLGVLHGGTYSYGYGVNARGQVVGFGDTHIVGQSHLVPHAFISAPNSGPLTDLGTLGGTDSRGGPGFSDTGISGSPSGLDRRGDHAKTET